MKGSSYLYILAAIGAGTILGIVAPQAGAAMKPLGDMFIAAVKMIITPVIFLTIVTGIAASKDVGEQCRVVPEPRRPECPAIVSRSGFLS